MKAHWKAVYYRESTDSTVRVKVRDWDEYTSEKSQLYEADCLAQVNPPIGFTYMGVTLNVSKQK